MLFSLNLLKQYISLDRDPKDLMSDLTRSSCEVEHVTVRQIPALVVIGYVVSTVKHPNADSLMICQLDCWSHGHYQICTAADNIRADIYVPVALPWCYLPALDMTIGSRKMRGEDSNGMICAKTELGIDEDADAHGIWIMDDDFQELTKEDLGIALAVKYPRLDNTILDVDNKTITNRPDLTGLLGMAIELNARYRAEPDLAHHLKQTNITHVLDEHNPTTTLQLLSHATKSARKVTIQTDKVRAYMTIDLDAINVRPSDFFTRLGLIDSGHSTRNNRVDFSNLFMTTTSQPVHFFDADTIQWSIVVRAGIDGESFTDLTDKTHTLTTNDIVIADDSGVIALGWVVGWLHTAITDNTKSIMVEIANFDPVSVRRTSVRLGCRTDAVMRFEKNMNPCLTIVSFGLMMDMIKQHKALIDEPVFTWLSYWMNDETTSLMSSGRYIDFDPIRCHQIIYGTIAEESDLQTMQDILTLIGCRIEKNNAVWSVQSPRRRWPNDVAIPEDLYEEVARLSGYDNIETLATVDQTRHVPFPSIVRLHRQLEDILINQYNADQIQTYPWMDESFCELMGYKKENLIRLINSTAPELSHLRPSLIPNLLLATAKNAKTFDQFTIFDTGEIWDKTQVFSTQFHKQSYETFALGLVDYRLSDKDANWSDDTLLHVREMIDMIITQSHITTALTIKTTDHTHFHPRQQWLLMLGDVIIGSLASLHPHTLTALKLDPKASVTVTELYLERLDAIITTQWYSFQSDNSYQTLQDQIVTRDMAFVIDQSQAIGEMIDLVKAVPWVSQVDIFDIYQDPTGNKLAQDKKSLALTLTIVWDGSWTTEQINKVLFDAIEAVKSKGGELR